MENHVVHRGEQLLETLRSRPLHRSNAETYRDPQQYPRLTLSPGRRGVRTGSIRTVPPVRNGDRRTGSVRSCLRTRAERTRTDSVASSYGVYYGAGSGPNGMHRIGT